MREDPQGSASAGALAALALLVGSVWIGTPAAVAAVVGEDPQEAAVAADSPRGLTEQERRGKEIYLRGESFAGDPVTAVMGDAGVEVPAGALPCANCHGRDGKGKPEGGVEPSNLTWEALTKPYGVRHPSGREHPAYTPRLLKRAIAMGIDPAGNELHVAMPHYRMTVEDMEALIAYIQRLGSDADPGVGEDTLHLGTLLPPAGRTEAVGKTIESILAAYFDDINSGGGLYGRKVVLHAHHLPEDPAGWRRDVEAFVRDEDIFSLVGAFIAGADAEIPAALAALEVPLVGPFTLHPQSGFPINREVFYLLPGLATQMKVLADAAAGRHPAGGEAARPKAALVYPAGDELADAVAAAEEQAEKNGWEEVLARPIEPGSFDAAALARELSEAGAGVLWMLHPQGLEAAFLTAADRLGWHPEIYAPGVFAGEGLLAAPPGFEGKVLLSFPILPGDQTSRGLDRFRRLLTDHDLGAGSLTTQLSTLAAAEVLVEGLKRAGRSLSRAKLIDALEGLYDYHTGLVPPLTFGPNRRIGARGAYLVTLEVESRRLAPVGGWQEIR